LKNFASNFADR